MGWYGKSRPGLKNGHPQSLSAITPLNFDEHLLRQAFYKTLHTPYLTNTNGNCRTDSLLMIRAVAHFAPNALTIPQNDNGKSVFKLDQLAPANGFDHSSAHDAMADAEATTHLCRIITEREPGYWSGFVRFAQKAAVAGFALEEEVFALTDFYYGNPYSGMVTCIGVNPERSSELLVFNLSNDPDELATLEDDELGKRLAEPPRPVLRMRTNAAPIVLPWQDAPEALRNAAPDFDVLRERATRLRNDHRLSRRLITASVQTREKQEPSLHVEEQIYDGFTSNHDKTVMDRFHESDWSQRPTLLDRISDKRMRFLGQQLICVEAPALMPEAARREYDTAIARRLMADDDTVPWRTYPQAIREVDNLLATADTDSTLLTDLRQYLMQQAKEADSLLA